MGLTEGLALYLQSKDLVHYQIDGDCFLDRALPDRPIPAVAISTYGGPAPLGDLPYREVLVQILVRGGRDHPEYALRRAQTIHDALHGLGRVDLPDEEVTCMLSCFAQSASPSPLGPDKNGNPEFAVNLVCEIVRDTVATPP